MSKRELQEHLLRLWLDGKPLPTIQRKRTIAADGEHWKDILLLEGGEFLVPFLGMGEFRIKPKEYKVDQPVWVLSYGKWEPRHYAGLNSNGEHTCWSGGFTSHSVPYREDICVWEEITDEDPNG